LIFKKINPLYFLKTDELNRSDYFSSGFYPLNSLLHVVVLSPEPIKVKEVSTELLTTTVIDGEKIPTNLESEGWVFDPDAGKKIDGKYLFGKQLSASENSLLITLDSAENVDSITVIGTETASTDESIIIAIIIIAAGAAVAFYLKGYKK